jgi:predicted DNA-binding transcriptional regulator YafY
MYSPTTRLLTVLELLQTYKKMSGSEIARRLEVDGRTVRRYIVMLQEMGIPVEGERGPYGTYQLQRGFKMPPIVFSDGEAVALTLGLLTMRAFQFPVDEAAVEGALAKTERLMPEKLLNQVRGLQEAITFNAPPPPVLLQNSYVAALSLAVQQRQRVRLRYRSWQGEETEREFDPFGIVVNEGYWYTAGYCQLRRDLRTFRLDRILSLEPGTGSFERPEDFDVLGHVLTAIAQTPGPESVEVLIETTLEHARQVIPGVLGTLEETEQGVIFRRTASQLPWVAGVLITLDCPVTIIRPAELRELIQRMGQRALEIAGK